MSDDHLVEEICTYFDMCSVGYEALEEGNQLVDDLSLMERELKLIRQVIKDVEKDERLKLLSEIKQPKKSKTQKRFIAPSSHESPKRRKMRESSSVIASSSVSSSSSTSLPSTAPTTKTIEPLKLKAHKTVAGKSQITKPVNLINSTPPTPTQPKPTISTTVISSSSSTATTPLPSRVSTQILSSDEDKDEDSDSTDEISQNLSSRQTMSPEGRLLQMNRAAIRRSSRLKKRKTSNSILRPFITFPYCPRSSIFVPKDSSKLQNFDECLVNQFDRILSTLTLFAHTAIRNNNIPLYELISSEISQFTPENESTCDFVYKPYLSFDTISKLVADIQQGKILQYKNGQLVHIPFSEEEVAMLTKQIESNQELKLLGRTTEDINQFLIDVEQDKPKYPNQLRWRVNSNSTCANVTQTIVSQTMAKNPPKLLNQLSKREMQFQPFFSNYHRAVHKTQFYSSLWSNPSISISRKLPYAVIDANFVKESQDRLLACSVSSDTDSSTTCSFADVIDLQPQSTMEENKKHHVVHGHANGVFFFNQLGPKFYLSASYDSKLKLWSPNDMQLIQTLEAHKTAPMAVSIHSNEKLFASCGDTLYLWNPYQKMDVVAELRVENSKSIFDITFGAGPTKDHLFCMYETEAKAKKKFESNPSQACAFDINKNTIIQSFDFHEQVTAMSVSRDGKLFATGWENGRLELIETKSYDATKRSSIVQQFKKSFGAVSLHRECEDSINEISFSACGTYLATSGWDGHVMVFDLRKPEQLLLQWKHQNTLHNKINGSFVAFGNRPYSTLLTSAGEDATMCVFDISRGDPLILSHTKNDSSSYNFVKFSADDESIVTGTDHGLIVLFSINHQRVLDDIIQE